MGARRLGRRHVAASPRSRAETPTTVRITLARSVSGIPLWGIGPFAEKAGFHVEYIPAGTNADMQRNLQSGVEMGTLGYQTPAIMAEQNVSNVKVVAGEQFGGQNLIMRKGVQSKLEGAEGKRIGRPPGSYVAILFTFAAGKWRGSVQGQSDQHDAGRPRRTASAQIGDLDALVLWSPVIDRAVVEGYGYYPACCE